MATHKRSTKESERSAAKSPMTVAEAGRRGGASTAERHGKSFYATIGRKGGQSRSARLQGRQADEAESSESRLPTHRGS